MAMINYYDDDDDDDDEDDDWYERLRRSRTIMHLPCGHRGGDGAEATLSFVFSSIFIFFIFPFFFLPCLFYLANLGEAVILFSYLGEERVALILRI